MPWAPTRFYEAKPNKTTAARRLGQDTAGYPASAYELSALALPVQGETNLENNSYDHAIVKLTKPSTGPASSSSFTGLSLGTETVILVSLGEALLGLYIIGRRLRGDSQKAVPRTKRP